MQVDSEVSSAKQKRQLVRKMTLNHHTNAVKKEFVAEAAFGLLGWLFFSLLCTAAPQMCHYLGDGVLNIAAYTFVGFIMHHLILATAYYSCARFGTKWSITVGIFTCIMYYCCVTSVVQMMLQMPVLPAQLDLQPWNRDSNPNYVVAMLLWPFFGTSVEWRWIHVASNCLAWCFGAYQWNKTWGFMKKSNGIMF